LIHISIAVQLFSETSFRRFRRNEVRNGNDSSRETSPLKTLNEGRRGFVDVATAGHGAERRSLDAVLIMTHRLG